MMTILAKDELYLESLKNISRSVSNMNSLKSEESTQSLEKTTCNSISDVFVTINTATGNQVSIMIMINRI
jgi:uncharacterized protein YbcI